jgi:hypothetical protein
MLRDIIFLIIGAVASGFFSWLFTHIYYRKSLGGQERTAESQIKALTSALETQNSGNSALLKQKRIEECTAEYKRAGTPVRVIDTYTDLTNEEKADLLDTVSLRAKGRPAKNNKYREK